MDGEGFCIACGDEINYNPGAPYCYGCYVNWQQWENPNYTETHCHCCGKPHHSSMNKPLCYSCFSVKEKEHGPLPF